MMRDRRAYERFERDLIKSTKPDFFKNVRLLEAMYEEARGLGAFSREDSMDGVETAIRIARVVNLVRGDSLKDSDRDG